MVTMKKSTVFSPSNASDWSLEPISLFNLLLQWLVHLHLQRWVHHHRACHHRAYHHQAYHLAFHPELLDTTLQQLVNIFSQFPFASPRTHPLMHSKTI